MISTAATSPSPRVESWRACRRGVSCHVAIIHVVTTITQLAKPTPPRSRAQRVPAFSRFHRGPAGGRSPRATHPAPRDAAVFISAFPLAMLLIIALALAPRCAHGADGRHGPPVIFEGDTEDAGAASSGRRRRRSRSCATSRASTSSSSRRPSLPSWPARAASRTRQGSHSSATSTTRRRAARSISRVADIVWRTS